MPLSADIQGSALEGLRRTLAGLVDGPKGVRVGVLEGATNEDGDNVAEYAAYNEFGTDRIPPRPLLRTTISEKGREWSDLAKGFLMAGVKAGAADAGRRALDAAGRQAQVDIQDKLMSNMPPPNAPATAARKAGRKGGGYAGTLFETGALHKSIQYEITETAE